MTEKHTHTLEEDEVKTETNEEVSLETDQVNHETENPDQEVIDTDDVTENETALLITKYEEEISELKNRLLRSQADLENFRRRSREEKEAAAKYRSQPLIESLLPFIDNFERGLLVKPESEESKSLLKGLEMVYRQLQDVLKSEGVEIIETTGQSFDPNVHQAVMQVEEEGFESGVIVEELQKGYKLKDRVIRPSMVKVNA